MSTTPNPVQSFEGWDKPYIKDTEPIPPGWSSMTAKAPNSPKLSDLLNTAHGALSSLRDKYASMVNDLADAITAKTPNYADMPDETKRDLGAVVKAGLGAYGVPVTPTKKQQASEPGAYQTKPGGEIENSSPAESVVTPKGGEETPPVTIPKGTQKLDKIMSKISDAASQSQTMHMTYHNPEWDEPKVYTVEPYSYRGDGNTLMAYDTMGKGIRAFKLENIKNVIPSGQTFKPRWQVEIAPPAPKKSK